jgi:2-C-methyl-D-erythritol 4-phosphate cytidylyltransferase
LKYWVVVAAAGIGKRFGSPLPKQYASINGKTVIEHCLERLLVMRCERIVVALGNQDDRWRELTIFNNPRITTIGGGDTRAESVCNALDAISARASVDDWVLVHDAVRPCVTVADIERLVADLRQSDIGGLLGTPVKATLKRLLPPITGEDREFGEGMVGETIDRNNLWLAETPQMFRYGPLVAAMRRCLANGVTVTDEAEAMEICGYKPIMVGGRADNLKITTAEDLVLAEAILRGQWGVGI